MWDAEEEEEEEAGEGGADSGSGGYAFPLRRKAEVVSSVSGGDGSALAGLIGSYTKKRVRWADLEQAKVRVRVRVRVRV